MFKAETFFFKIAPSTAIFPGRVENRQSLGVQSHAKQAAHVEGSHARTALKIKKLLKKLVEKSLGYNMFKAETFIFKIAPSMAIFLRRIENRQSLGVQSHAKRAAHVEGSHARMASKIKKPLKSVIENGLGYNIFKAETSIS